MMDYTVEIYKRDGRSKTGEKLIDKIDLPNMDKAEVEQLFDVNRPALKKCRIEIHETWVVKKNMMSGVEFKERYDTPHYCSPSSESYWSM